jgi:hypothetical protein
MKAVERRTYEVLLCTWKSLLDKLNRIGPASDEHDEIEAFAEVKDYILDRIEAAEKVLHNADRPRHYLRRKGNSLPGRDNPVDNQSRSGVDNV